MTHLIHIEDDLLTRMMVEGVFKAELKNTDVKFHSFENPGEGETFAANLNEPFILATDLNLPEPIGGEILNRLRTLVGDAMYGVILSATPDLEHIQGMAPDANEVIEKPTRVSEISSVLRRIINDAKKFHENPPAAI
jgi:CheY-like chemotaxis protein